MTTDGADATDAPMTGAARFDVREFARTAVGTHRDRLDVEALAAQPLPPDALRAMRVLRDLEAATMDRLRKVLVTATHKDARVTAFLVSWAFEKFWIADALTAVIDAQPGSQSDDSGATGAAVPRSPGDRRARRGPVRRSLSGFLAGESIVAVHVTTGLVDDWMLRAAYERVIERSENPEIGRALGDVLDLKARHSRFFEEEAMHRLLDSPRAVRLTRRELRRDVLPLGAVAIARADRAFFRWFSFGGEIGPVRAQRVVACVSDLPGMDDGTIEAVQQRLAA
ncbi:MULTISPECIES: hypothetical protein [unclassified Leifsonia]|uniref:hypothetical protein n=1 Tax=unclassified Leifsonia TaxID=2663824 RepID=UPI0006F9039B|nr:MULTISPECIES: hypothetical protein [unclassified Leifsonia]KQX06681.1 hypothetical protein ASC59_02195 [Leifsonia sp. Root1293]KRA10965.1 hypothetical protein ASD61_02195 [Leifsonia sp. Root60]